MLAPLLGKHEQRQARLSVKIYSAINGWDEFLRLSSKQNFDLIKLLPVGFIFGYLHPA
jgi:hypothetical protein